MKNKMLLKELIYWKNRGEFMTLDEAIAHEKELAKEIYIEAMLCHANPDDGKLDDCIERGKYHEQIAEWLEDYECIRQWKSDIMDSFCKYDVSSFEELVTNARNKAIDDYMKSIRDIVFNYYTNEAYIKYDDLLMKATQLKAGIVND